MLYSHTLEEQKFFSFSLFLKSLMKGDSIYKSVVRCVLLEAKDYVDERKDIYSLNKEYYSITIFFASNAKSALNDIDIDKINVSDYKKLLDFLEKRPISQQYHEFSVC